MYLKKISLQSFRNYSKQEFHFNEGTTYIVGPNTSGKTNLIESIHLLTTGKSFRSDKDIQLIAFGKNLSKVKGVVQDTELEVVLSLGEEEDDFIKKYLVNGVSKRRNTFMGNLFTVLFSPMDLEIIIGGPGIRRKTIDTILEQTDYEYRSALIDYTKALRQRNALLELAQETGRRNEKQFEYWDELLIKKGGMVTKKREEYLLYLNSSEKNIFDFAVTYDSSIISKERLEKYQQAELGAGVTLVGPHRDDFIFHMFDNVLQKTHDIRSYGSRGQQRLLILQLKLLEIEYIEKKVGEKPILLLDDIFSELDSGHIQLIMEMVGNQQTIITTTHEEFIGAKQKKGVSVVKLGE